MAKKKLKIERKGSFYGLRCSDDDAADFEKVAHIEGFSTVQQWLLALGRRRSRAVLKAAERGDVRISETLIVVDQDGIGSGNH